MKTIFCSFEPKENAVTSTSPNTSAKFGALLAASLLAATVAQASLALTIQQVGSDVVLTSSGGLAHPANIVGIPQGNADFNTPIGGSGIAPAGGDILLAAPSQNLLWGVWQGAVINGPASFGSGGATLPSAVSNPFNGSSIGIDMSGTTGDLYYVPATGSFDDAPSPPGIGNGITATWSNTTIAGLGLTEGTFVYELDARFGNNQTITMFIVPEPNTFGLIGLGGLALAFLRRRMRSA